MPRDKRVRSVVLGALVASGVAVTGMSAFAAGPAGPGPSPMAPAPAVIPTPVAPQVKAPQAPAVMAPVIPNGPVPTAAELPDGRRQYKPQVIGTSEPAGTDHAAPSTQQSNEPIPGIDIVVLRRPIGKAFTLKTDDNGVFTLPKKLAPGDYAFDLSKSLAPALGAGKASIRDDDSVAVVALLLPAVQQAREASRIPTNPAPTGKLRVEHAFVGKEAKFTLTIPKGNQAIRIDWGDGTGSQPVSYVTTVYATQGGAPDLTGGVHVAVGDVNGDGRADFNGGVHVAVGDVNGDGIIAIYSGDATIAGTLVKIASTDNKSGSTGGPMSYCTAPGCNTLWEPSTSR